MLVVALVKYFDIRFFLDLDWELHITNKGYDELQLALPCVPTTLSLQMGRSEPETQVSKRVWRNIGGANTAINGKRGGGGGLSQNFKS